MERKRVCRYCQKDFIAKRIDAKYCSQSCRQMGYRRESDPWTYGKVVPVYFELDDDEYRSFLNWAADEGKHPNEFAKEIAVKGRQGLIKVFFTPYEMSRYLNHFDVIFENVSLEKLIHDWTMERAKMEMDKFENR